MQTQQTVSRGIDQIQQRLVTSVNMMTEEMGEKEEERRQDRQEHQNYTMLATVSFHCSPPPTAASLIER